MSRFTRWLVEIAASSGNLRDPYRSKELPFATLKMDLQNTITEPFVKILNFHNDFNRHIKLSVGALEFWKASAMAAANGISMTLPTGSEPWGATHLKNPKDATEKTEAFIAELGIVRAASAFEDYISGADAELNRAKPNPDAVVADSSHARLMARLRIDRAAITNLLTVAEFFIVARNCIVHRSGRASSELAALSANESFRKALATTPKRKGKWRVSIPLVEAGIPVSWQPRHAIMASDAFFKLAQALDDQLVESLSAVGIVRMAAYWCFFDTNPAPCVAKRDAQTMIRSQLADRYSVNDASEGETIAHLKSIGKWDACLKEYVRRFPNGGRVRDQKKSAGKKK